MFEIEKWTNTGGTNWKAEAITEGSSKDNVRPFAIRNAKEDDPLQVLGCRIQNISITQIFYLL